MSSAVQTSIENMQTAKRPREHPVPSSAAVLVEPLRKKPTTSLVLLKDFHLTDDLFQSIVKMPKCNLVPLSHSGDSTARVPVLVQIGGGGIIPKSFGIEDKDQDGKRKVQISLQVDCLDDHRQFVRMRKELGEVVVNRWKDWFPDSIPPSADVLLSCCAKIVTDRKKKKNSEDTWSGTTKASIEVGDLKCKILDRDTLEIVPFESLPGMRWHKAIFELKWVFIQATKSYGITKKLRYLLCSVGEVATEVEPILLKDFHVTETLLQSMVKMPKCNLVPLSHPCDPNTRVPVLVRIEGGGVIPKAFGIDDKDQDGKRIVKLTLKVDCLDDHAQFVRVRTELGEMVVKKWKEWYPDSLPPSDEVLRSCCANLVSVRKKKKNSEDTWSGTTKAVLDVDDAKCEILDRDTLECVPFDALPGMLWHTAIFEFKWIFIQATKSYGINKKLRYLLCSAGEAEEDVEPL